MTVPTTRIESRAVSIIRNTVSSKHHGIPSQDRIKGIGKLFIAPSFAGFLTPAW